MRKITEQIAQAFIEGRTDSLDNTASTGNALTLHGNTIARREHGAIQISSAGWQTTTTKERLNGLLTLLGIQYGITQKDWVWYLNGTCMDSTAFYIVTTEGIQQIN